MIGGMIRKRREELELTQEELATKLGYKSKSTINKIEMGVNDITQSKIIAFAKALKTTPSYLMGWEEPDTNKNQVICEECFPYCTDPTEKELHNAMLELNQEGKEKVLEYAKDLQGTGRYKKFDKSGVG